MLRKEVRQQGMHVDYKLRVIRRSAATASATIQMELPSSSGGGNDASNGATTMSMAIAPRFRISRFLFTAVDARKAVDNVGANFAPWNIANYRIDFRDGRVMVDATPLIFFHFLIHAW